MQRYVSHTQPSPGSLQIARTLEEHHCEMADAAHFGKQLGVAGVVMAGCVQCGFAERRSDEAIDPFFECPAGSGRYAFIRRFARSLVDNSCRRGPSVLAANIDDGYNSGVRRQVVYVVDRIQNDELCAAADEIC